VRLRGEPVFVDQSAEQVLAADAVEGDQLDPRLLGFRRERTERGPLVKCAVWPVLVAATMAGLMRWAPRETLGKLFRKYHGHAPPLTVIQGGLSGTAVAAPEETS
jgi:hypothetical protein